MDFAGEWELRAAGWLCLIMSQTNSKIKQKSTHFLLRYYTNPSQYDFRPGQPIPDPVFEEFNRHP